MSVGRGGTGREGEARVRGSSGERRRKLESSKEKDNKGPTDGARERVGVVKNSVGNRIRRIIPIEFL